MKHYDYIIIGTGIGGSVLALKLAETYKSILILERGGFIPKEQENWDAKAVFTEGRYRPDESWYDENDKAFKPFIHYNVGGNSKMYGGAMFRFRETDFEEVEHYGGTSPKWDLSYQDFKKYYTEAEGLFSVHGTRGSDPTEPIENRAYPFPALDYEADIQKLSDRLEEIGLKPFPIPLAVSLPQDSQKNVPAVNIENFDGFPDPTEAKAEGYTVGLKPILNKENVTLITQAYVSKLVTDTEGKRVVKVIALVDGIEQEFVSDNVIVACGAVNSAALLLRSANEKHPNGLANGSGMVGRNLMLHHNGCLVAFIKGPNNSLLQKSFGLADYYHKGADGSFPLGEIQLMGRNDPDTINWLAKDIFPGKSYEELKAHSIDFWLTAEDLPSPENRVTLREDGSIRITYQRNNYEAFNRLKEALKKIFEDLGKIDTDYVDTIWEGYDLDVSGMSHQNGTLRFGSDPNTSVLNLNCKAHELDNLYVVDASFFPSCGAFNPSLTIVANALRVAEHIKREIIW
jgi:choline dehydrogenase-like flavoprotein